MAGVSPLPCVSSSTPARILVVDDQPEIVSALQDYFGTRGYTVHTASDGISAIEKAKQTPLDVIVLDLLMPKMDGLDVCERLKTDPATADIGIIVLTAVDKLDIRLNALQNGADDYITKPFSFHELELRVSLQVRAAVKRREYRALLHGERRKTGNLEIVAEMARQITTLDDSDLYAVCDATVQSLVDRFEYEYVSVHLVDREADETILYAKAGTLTSVQEIGYRFSVNTGIVGLVCLTGKAYLCNDATDDPYFVLNPVDPDVWTHIRSEICVPIKTVDQVLGCINIESTQVDAFEASDQLMLETLAGHLAVALTNARLYRESVERNTELGVHTEILAALNATRDVQALFQTISHQIVRLIPHDGMAVARYDDRNQTVTALYIEDPDEHLHTGVSFPADRMPYTMEAFRKGSPVSVDDIRCIDTLPPPILERMKRNGTRSQLLAPIRYQEEIIGILILMHRETGAFTPEHIKQVQQLSPHIALAVAQAEAYEALQRAYANLEKAQENIIQSEREKAALDTVLQTGLTLSHEINNPLTAVIGFAELLVREHPDQTEYRIILEAGQRISDVVRRLRQLKVVRLKSYVTDIPIQMLDLDLPSDSQLREDPKAEEP